jgi:plastocyanin
MNNVWKIAGALGLAALTGAAMGAVLPATADAPKVVGIDNFTFGPPKLTVAVGTTVTWANHDDIPHTVVSSPDPKIFKSSPLDTDDTFSFTFTKAGTFKYFCSIHPKMVGAVIVK